MVDKISKSGISNIGSYLMPLSIAGNVLLLGDDGEEGELPIVDTGVQLLVQGLEVIQCSSDNPPPEKNNQCLLYE